MEMERVPVSDSYAVQWHASLETRGPGFMRWALACEFGNSRSRDLPILE